MPKFITIGYGDRDGYDQTPQAVRDAAHKNDASLKREGALLAIAGAPIQVRNPDASRVETREGAFMRSELPIAGFAVIEAEDRDDAVRKVAGSPCAVAHGVIEVWPLE
jgi:hypothetical protein